MDWGMAYKCTVKKEFYDGQNNLKQHLVPVRGWALLAARDVKIKLDMVSAIEFSNDCHVTTFNVETCSLAPHSKCVHPVIAF